MADNTSVSKPFPLNLTGTPPIHRLPVEVLRMVFNALRLHHDELLDASNAQPATRDDLRAGLVCRRWRAILLDMPAVWADTLVYTVIKQESVTYTETLVKRSALLPLRFCRHQSPRAVCTTLRPAWARIRGLFVSVTSSEDLPVLHTVVGCDMPGLRELVINFCAMQEQLLPALARYDLKPWEDANLPKLEELRTNAAYFALAGAATASLRELTVAGQVSAVRFRAMLRRCVSLKTLALRGFQIQPEDLMYGPNKRDLVHLPVLSSVYLDGGNAHSLAHLLPDLKGPPGERVAYNIESQDEYFVDRILASLPPEWAFPGFRGAPLIRLVWLIISSLDWTVWCGGYVDRLPVFAATVDLNVHGVPAGNNMRLYNALYSILRRFPDTATELNVDVGPQDLRDKHPELWNLALWQMVFWTRPSFTVINLFAKTDIDVKKLVAMAFLEHVARRCLSLSDTLEDQLEISLSWAIASVHGQRRPGLKEIAEEIAVLGDVLVGWALPEMCVFDLVIECTTADTAFVHYVRALSEAWITGGERTDTAETETETAVRTQLGRLLTVVGDFDVAVNNSRGELCEIMHMLDWTRYSQESVVDQL